MLYKSSIYLLTYLLTYLLILTTVKAIYNTSNRCNVRLDEKYKHVLEANKYRLSSAYWTR